MGHSAGQVLALLCGDMVLKVESCRGDTGLVLVVCALGETGALGEGQDWVLWGMMGESRGCWRGCKGSLVRVRRLKGGEALYTLEWP